MADVSRIQEPQGRAEAEEAAGVRRVEPEPPGGTAEPRREAPAATAEDTERRATCRPCRPIIRSTLVVRNVGILAPLPYIAVKIEKAEGVRPAGADFVGMPVRIRGVPRIFPKELLVVTE